MIRAMPDLQLPSQQQNIDVRDGYGLDRPNGWIEWGVVSGVLGDRL